MQGVQPCVLSVVHVRNTSVIVMGVILTYHKELPGPSKAFCKYDSVSGLQKRLRIIILFDAEKRYLLFAFDKICTTITCVIFPAFLDESVEKFNFSKHFKGSNNFASSVVKPHPSFPLWPKSRTFQAVLFTVLKKKILNQLHQDTYESDNVIRPVAQIGKGKPKTEETLFETLRQYYRQVSNYALLEPSGAKASTLLEFARFITGFGEVMRRAMDYIITELVF